MPTRFKRIAPPGLSGTIQKVSDIDDRLTFVENDSIPAIEKRLDNIERWLGTSDSDSVICYISPDGTDTELDYVRISLDNISTYRGTTQYASAAFVGDYRQIVITDNHIGYYVITTENFNPATTRYGDGSYSRPFYSINKACSFLTKFRATKQTGFYILMKPGNYTYSESQSIYHPDANGGFGNKNIIYIIVTDTIDGIYNSANRATVKFTNVASGSTTPYLKIAKCTALIAGITFELDQAAIKSGTTVLTNWKNTRGIDISDGSSLQLLDVNVANFAQGIATMSGSTLAIRGTNYISIEEDLSAFVAPGESNTLTYATNSSCGIYLSSAIFDMSCAAGDTTNIYIENYVTGIIAMANTSTNAYAYPDANNIYGQYNIYISSFSEFAIAASLFSVFIGLVPKFYPFYKFGTAGNYSSLTNDTSKPIIGEFNGMEGSFWGNVMREIGYINSSNVYVTFATWDGTKFVDTNNTTRNIGDTITVDGTSYTLVSEWNHLNEKEHPAHNLYLIKTTAANSTPKITNLTKLKDIDMVAGASIS